MVQRERKAKLIGFRKMAGVSQEEMANKIGMVQATYSRKESGIVSFDEKEMIQVYEVLKEKIPEVKITDLFFNK